MNINEGFKHACKFIFGQEIGEMQEYEDYLKQGMIGRFVKSSFSQKDIFITSEEFAPGIKFFDYCGEYEKAKEALSKPFNINDIKDVDSLFEAMQEKAVYAGGKVLGNSANVADSDNIINCNHVSHSSMIINSRYMAYCHLSRNSEYEFASNSSGDSQWIMRCFYNNRLQRCFECATTINTRDAYFCYHLANCSDCMFTFNVRVKNRMVGNISLEKSKYDEIKKKLLEEIVDLLKKNKGLDFSVLNIMGGQA